MTLPLRAVPVVPGPAWLQTAQWVLDPVACMLRGRKYGADCFAARIAGSRDHPLIFVQDPQVLKFLFTHDRDQLYAPGDGIAVLEPLIGSTSVVMLEGERHVCRRRLLLPPFHGERLHVYAESISRIAGEQAARERVNRPFRALALAQRISLDVILESVFGFDEGIRADEMRRLLTEVFDSFSSPLTSAFLYYKALQRSWSPWGAFLRRRRRLDAILYEAIEHRSAGVRQGRGDVLSLLLDARDEQGRGLTPRELRDELMTLVLAGLETTSTVMAWALHWIHARPDVLRRLLDELANRPSDTTWADTARLPYLSAVCNEVLRIHPPVPFTFARLAREDLEINGWSFPAGSRIVGCIYLLHHRHDLYPEPAEFRPERFLERKFGLSEFMPFGAGARRCIGESLALLEIKVAIATLLSAHSFKLADQRREKPRRRGVILAPARGVPIRITGPSPASSAAVSAR